MIHSLSYSIPDELVVSAVPGKTRVLSEIRPDFERKYSFKAGEEEQYFQQYRESRFAMSPRKGGFDCLRHYEIMACGCIPLIDGLEGFPTDTMTTLPRDLLLKARAELWPWVESPEKAERYRWYVDRMLEHVRTHCTTSASARHFLVAARVSNPPPPKVLMLTCHPGENYTRELLCIGLRRLLGTNFIEAPKLPVLYRGNDLSRFYGNGFTYGGRLPDIPLDRERIAERLAAREFDLIIYGKVGMDEGPQGRPPFLPFFVEVFSHYKKHEVAFLFGGDGCQTFAPLCQNTYSYSAVLFTAAHLGHCFVRELDKRE